MATRKTDIRMVQDNSEKYIALEDLEFGWLISDLQKVRSLWNKGYSIDKISRKVGREIDEVALLIMDLARKGKIKHRKNGVFGDV